MTHPPWMPPLHLHTIMVTAGTEEEEEGGNIIAAVAFNGPCPQSLLKCFIVASRPVSRVVTGRRKPVVLYLLAVVIVTTIGIAATSLAAKELCTRSGIGARLLISYLPRKKKQTTNMSNTITLNGAKVCNCSVCE